MPLIKKIITISVILFFITSFLSGCIFEDILGLNNFSLDSWNVCDNEGFPALNITFSCKKTVNLKIISPGSIVIDNDFFFIGKHSAFLNIGNYRSNPSPGTYHLKAYDTDNNELFSKSFSFKGAKLQISSIEQKWWKNQDDKYSLLGFRINTKNTGDLVAYPYKLYVTMDTEGSSLTLPVNILPGESKYIESIYYKEAAPKADTFTVKIKDKDEETLASSSDEIDVEGNVDTQEYKLKYNSGTRYPEIPKADFLYDYYSNLKRTNYEDYSLYVFDPYDDSYIDIVLDCIFYGLSFSKNSDKINYIVSLAQNLDYSADSETDSSYEYPRYPVETLFNGRSGGGDCEDKAILTVSLIEKFDFNVSLFRFPNHMAVGVELAKSEIPYYDYYFDNYFFLETTTEGKPCGFVPNEYRDSVSDVTVYEIKSRALLTHDWLDDSLTIYTNTERGDLVKIVVFVENRGTDDAYSVKLIGGFYKYSGLKVNSEEETIPLIKANDKKKLSFTVSIPQSFETWFKTRIYYDYQIIDEKESYSSFPT